MLLMRYNGSGQIGIDGCDGNRIFENQLDGVNKSALNIG